MLWQAQKRMGAGELLFARSLKALAKWFKCQWIQCTKAPKCLKT
jgi:hypothetical protein